MNTQATPRPVERLVRPSKPQWDIIPAPGSNRWEMAGEETQSSWADWAASPCMICGQILGYCTAILTWLPDENAHVSCHEDRLEEERLFLLNAPLIERTAKAREMTIEAFKELPSWDRARFMREQVEKERANDKLTGGDTKP